MPTFKISHPEKRIRANNTLSHTHSNNTQLSNPFFSTDDLAKPHENMANKAIAVLINSSGKNGEYCVQYMSVNIHILPMFV